MKRQNIAAEEDNEGAEEVVAKKQLKKKAKKADTTAGAASTAAADATPSPKVKKLKKKGTKKQAEKDVPEETTAEEEPLETVASEDTAPAAESTKSEAPTVDLNAGQNDSEFQDQTLSCRDCGADFVFTASQQEFFKSKGFENKPSRCKECQQAKKMGGGGSQGDRGGGRGRGRGRFDQGGRGGGGGARACYNCGEEGHVSKDCPKPAQPNICFAFKQGKCTRGDSCRFQHV